eukprot:6149245-Amphidinium_carterae.2
MSHGGGVGCRTWGSCDRCRSSMRNLAPALTWRSEGITALRRACAWDEKPEGSRLDGEVSSIRCKGIDAIYSMAVNSTSGLTILHLQKGLVTSPQLSEISTKPNALEQLGKDFLSPHDDDEVGYGCLKASYSAATALAPVMAGGTPSSCRCNRHFTRRVRWLDS